MKREIRNKRHNLQKQWETLRGLTLDIGRKDAVKLRQEEDKIYKKWLFYDNIIKKWRVVNEKKSNIDSNL